MWKSNIKQAFRYIINQKNYSFVIIIGLSVGFAAFFLIYSYLFYEKSYDSFYDQGDDLYRVVVKENNDKNDPYKSPYSYSPQGPVALEEVPEVKNYVRLMAFPQIVVSPETNNETNSISVHDFYFADETFFELFSFPLILGEPKSVLKEPGSVVISESMANKLFGDQNPLGKILHYDDKYNGNITGVFKDIPKNTHLKFEMLFSMSSLPWIMKSGNAWSNHSFFTYLLLDKDADPQKVESKITTAYLKEERAINQRTCVWELQPVDEAYLNTSTFTSKPGALKFGDERMVYFLGLIAALILCVAWVNYVNLNTAKSSDRAKEIRVRKTSGAGKFQLIVLLITESLMFNIFSIILAALISAFVFGWFADMLDFSFYSRTDFWVIIGIILLTGCFFPAFFMAFSVPGLSPVGSKTSKRNLFSKSSFRNGLVIFQFIIIIALITSVVVVNKQLNFIHSVDLGFQKDQVLVLNYPRIGLNSKENQFDVFKEELTRHPEISDVTAAVSIPGQRFGSGNGGPHLQGQESSDTYFRIGRVMPNFIDFFGIKLLTGKNFSKSQKLNEKSIIINEEALKEFGLKNADEAINKKAYWNGKEVSIIGVAQSFHQQSLHIVPEPMIMYCMSFENSLNYLLVKLNSGSLDNTLALIKDEYSALFPNNPSDYFFLDNFFEIQYKKDIAFRKLFSFFSVIALFIGFFGLYGLTTFRIIKQTKEIGIRKVNGAKATEVLTMLNKDFVSWIAIAFIIAVPVSLFALNAWLENFAYKIDISWWMFILSGCIVFILTMFTVSWQTFRAARKNPVEALRYE